MRLSDAEIDKLGNALDIALEAWVDAVVARDDVTAKRFWCIAALLCIVAPELKESSQ